MKHTLSNKTPRKKRKRSLKMCFYILKKITWCITFSAVVADVWNYFSLGWCHRCPTSVHPAFNVQSHFSWKVSLITHHNIFLGISYPAKKNILTTLFVNKDGRPTRGTCSSRMLTRFFLICLRSKNEEVRFIKSSLFHKSTNRYLEDFPDSTTSTNLLQYPWQQDKLVAGLCCAQCMFAAV